MIYNKDNDKIFIKIERGEYIHLQILNVINNLSLDSGLIIGIGAVTDVELGYFNIDTKEYSSRKFTENYELVSFIGNISFRDGKRFIHTHVSLSDYSFKVIGGHLFDAKVAAAAEFVILPAKQLINRKFNSDIGLALWDFANE